jgi:hypothetical protein
MQSSTTSVARVYSTLRTIAMWLVIVINAALASACLLGIIRQYGVSTIHSDGRLPTPWETGLAPYLVALLAGVLISAVWAGIGGRSGRRSLMICTVIYMLFVYYQSIHFLVIRKEISRSADANHPRHSMVCRNHFLVATFLLVSHGHVPSTGLTIGSCDRGPLIVRRLSVSVFFFGVTI